MAGQSFVMFRWSWTEVSVLGSRVFGQALMESCASFLTVRQQKNQLLIKYCLFCLVKLNNIFYWPLSSLKHIAEVTDFQIQKRCSIAYTI